MAKKMMYLDGLKISKMVVLKHLEGDEEKVSRLIEWAHGGPANARVEDVEIRNEEFTGEFSKFDVLY